MPSIVWGRHPQEAYDNPYEYEAQDQFCREAKALLADLNIRLDQYTLHYHRDDQSLGKATWMLALDLVDSLLECAELLREKRHRPASRLFRDAVETMDLLKVFHSDTERGRKALDAWYQSKTIPHRESRAYLREMEGVDVANERRKFYDELSKFTHRTYRALMHSFSLGRDDLLVHDSHSMNVLVLPQTIAAYLAILADLIIQSSACLQESKALLPYEVDAAWVTSLEENTIPRRFASQ